MHRSPGIYRDFVFITTLCVKTLTRSLRETCNVIRTPFPQPPNSPPPSVSSPFVSFLWSTPPPSVHTHTTHIHTDADTYTCTRVTYKSNKNKKRRRKMFPYAMLVPALAAAFYNPSQNNYSSRFKHETCIE